MSAWPGVFTLGEGGPPPAGLPPVSPTRAWFDADDLASLTVTGPLVTQWSDKSGNGFHATAAAPNAPVLTRGANGSFNDRRILTFPNAQVLDSAAPADDQTSTVFVVAACNLTNSTRAMIGSTADGGHEFRLTSANALESVKQGVASMGVQSNATMTDHVPFLAVCVQASTTSAEHILNGVSEVDTHAQTLTAGRLLRIGGRSTTSDQWVGSIAEVIMYTTALSSGDITLVSDYLSDKWGTP